MGRLAEGWDEQEWRWRTDGFRAWMGPAAALPAWDGAPLAGRRLLVRAEQGLGDQVMFATMLPELEAAGGPVAVQCDRRLCPLFARSFPALGFAPFPTPEGEAAERDGFDLQIPFGSLGRLFRRDERAFPARAAVLVPDPGRTARLRSRWAERAAGRRRVGLSWRSLSPTSGARRSLALGALLPLLRRDDCLFVSLQYGPTAKAELDGIRDAHGIAIATEPEVEATDDIDGLAALVAALDLVVTVDNATAHLAGAVGAETWVPLPAVASWRWMIGREDSPWYPSLRLFRQPRRGDWAAVVVRLAAALEDRA
jgi:hypothetical protein